MKNATLNPSLAGLNADPLFFEGKLYIFGGKVINARLTKEGSQIEALYVPVNSRGYFDDYYRTDGRFLALLPKDRGILDPLIFKANREITIAAVYKGVRTERLEGMEYPYGYFEIVGIRLWAERAYYPPYYPYPYWYYDPWYEPWNRHQRWR